MRQSLALALILLPALAGCGASDHERVNPEVMLDQASAHRISNANVEIDAHLQVLGVDRLSQPLRLRVDGPYLSGGSERIPSFDWRLNASALGFPVGGRVLSTGSNVYLSLYGNDYEVGRTAMSAANQRLQEAAAAAGAPLDLRSWFGPGRVVGDDNAGGADCERITAPLRPEETAGDLAPLASALGFSQPPTVSGRANRMCRLRRPALSRASARCRGRASARGSRPARRGHWRTPERGRCDQRHRRAAADLAPPRQLPADPGPVSHT